MPGKDVQALVHESNVHQVELEIQNEELRHAQIELADTHDRYADLYEFAPVGYLNVCQRGEILQANLTASRMLDVDRSKLLGTNIAGFLTGELDDYTTRD